MSSSYIGRHRPPTRAERRRLEGRRRLPKALSAGYALPTAAAATLVISAGGATAAQSSAFAAPQEVKLASAALADPTLTATTRDQVAAAVTDHSELSTRRQASTLTVAEGQGRTQEKQHAARDKKRKKLAAEKKAREKAAEEAAKNGVNLSTDETAAGASEAATPQSWVRPVASGSVTSGYGPRWGRLHAGIDYGLPIGTPLMSMSSGVVTFSGSMSGYGNLVEIKYWDGTVSRYAHLNSMNVSVGQQVAPGEVVAQSGNTGRSTGPHLHLEIHPGGGGAIDPMPWLTARGLI